MRSVSRVIPVLAAALLVACTSSPSPTPSSTPSVAPSHTLTRSDPAPKQSVVLGCDDAGSGSRPAGAGNLVADALRVEGLTTPTPALSLASDAGLIVFPGSVQRFRKSPAWLPAGTPPVTIALIAPTAGQAFAWIPAQAWTGGGAPDLRPWLTTSITFTGCPDRDATYFGGVLASSGDSCLHLRLTQRGEPAQATRLQLDGRRCGA